MPNFNLSPNMSLPVPVPGVDPGPDYALNLNSSLLIVDAHNHTTGSGVPIPSSGLNINADLPFNGFNLTLARSIRFSIQGSPLALAPDVGCAYVSGLDLYFNDINGNQVRMTQGGAVAGPPGSISGLVPPASASYSVSLSTFTFQAGTNLAASLDAGSILIRGLTPSANAISLNAPTSLPTSYDLDLPSTLPTTMGVLSTDSNGVMIWTTLFDSVVGSAAQVTAGLATHSSLASAMTATATNGSIKVLRGTFSENIAITKTLFIEGSGVATVFSGNLTITSANYCQIENLKFTGNLSINSASGGNSITNCYCNSGVSISDDGSGDYLELIQG